MNNAVSNYLAHQGGWDEILMVVGPLGLIGGCLWFANKKLTKKINNQQNNSTNTLTQE